MVWRPSVHWRSLDCNNSICYMWRHTGSVEEGFMNVLQCCSRGKNKSVSGDIESICGIWYRSNVPPSFYNARDIRNFLIYYALNILNAYYLEFIWLLSHKLTKGKGSNVVHFVEGVTSSPFEGNSEDILMHFGKYIWLGNRWCKYGGITGGGPRSVAFRRSVRTLSSYAIGGNK